MDNQEKAHFKIDTSSELRCKRRDILEQIKKDHTAQFQHIRQVYFTETDQLSTTIREHADNLKKSFKTKASFADFDKLMKEYQNENFEMGLSLAEREESLKVLDKMISTKEDEVQKLISDI